MTAKGCRELDKGEMRKGKGRSSRARWGTKPLQFSPKILEKGIDKRQPVWYNIDSERENLYCERGEGKAEKVWPTRVRKTQADDLTARSPVVRDRNVNQALKWGNPDVGIRWKTR